MSFLRRASSAEELFATAAFLGCQAMALANRNSLADIEWAHEAARKSATSLSDTMPCKNDHASSCVVSASRRTRASRRIRSARLNSPPKIRTRAARYMK